MIILRCTARLRKELRIRETELVETPSKGFLGSWYANLLRIERRKCVLFTNERTLFSFFVPGLKRPDFEDFPAVFRAAFLAALANEGFGGPELDQANEACGETVFGRTESRSVLGSMNELAQMLRFHLQYDGGLKRVRVPDLNRRLNRIPMSGIRQVYAIEALQEAIGDSGS